MSNETGTLIAKLASTIEFGTYTVNVAQICHTHSTPNEMVKELVLEVFRH